MNQLKSQSFFLPHFDLELKAKNRQFDRTLHFGECYLQVIKRPRKVFKIVKFRWVVERTFGWMNYQRRLSKDYEYLPEHSTGWVKIAAINVMVRRLSPG